MKTWNSPPLAVSVALIGLFAFAYISDPSDEAMKGALIAGFAAAWGYWLGSSSGSQRKTDIMADIEDREP